MSIIDFALWQLPSKRFMLRVNIIIHLSELVQSLLRGTIAHFYMQNVARNPSQWTMSQFRKELFNYCFPHNLIELIQQKFDNLMQGRKSLVDYISIIEKMAECVPDVDNALKRCKLFEGANRYLQISWRWRGMSTILTSFKDLTETGPQACRVQ